ncbi:MAG: hypothetical protein SGILL_003725 [Bacillariaceae sp.]
MSLSIDERRDDKVNMAMLKQLFQSFMRAVCSLGLPVVFFLDDLQWMDDASMELIQSMLTDRSLSVMFLGAFRGNEVQEDHSVSKMTVELARAFFLETHLISLNELSRMDVAEFIKDTLSLQHTEAWELSEPIYEVTRGNINHVMQAIESLVRKDVLSRDVLTGAWQCSMPREDLEKEISATAVEMMKSKIEGLPTKLQQVVVIASHVRNAFKLSTLLECLREVGMPFSEEDLEFLLDDAILEGLLMHDEYNEEYIFVHDGVQEAARSIIYGEEVVRLFICIGQALSKIAYDDSQGEDWMVFAAAAGFEEAASFLRSGIDCLDSKSCWEKDYEQSLQLHHLLMDTEFTLGNYDNVRQHIGVVQEKARHVVDKGPAFVHSLGVIMQGKDRDHDMALKKGKAILSWLGLDIQVDPSDVKAEDIQDAESDCLFALEGRSVLDLLNEDRMEDDTIMSVLERMAKAAIYSGKVLFVYYLGQVAIRICAERGISEYLPRIYMYTQMYYRKLDLNLMAYECAVTCKKLIDEVPHASIESYCTVTVTCNNGLQLFRPTRRAVPVYEECYEKCIEAGNTEFAFLVANSYGMAFFFSGFRISNHSVETFEKIEESARACSQPPSVHAIFQVYRQLALNMQGRSADPVKFDGVAMKECELLEQFEPGSAPYKQTLRDLSSCKTMAALIHKDMPTLKSTITTLQEYPDFDILLHRFNMRLVWQALGAFLLARETRDSTYKKIAEKYRKLYKKGAEQGNPNATAISLCLEAENKQSKVNYNSAIEACRKHEFLHLEALMNENCGRYQEKQRKYSKAEEYIQEAFTLYQEYGANVKVRQLLDEFDFLKSDDVCKNVDPSTFPTKTEGLVRNVSTGTAQTSTITIASDASTMVASSGTNSTLGLGLAA